MSTVVVGVSDCRISDNPEDALITYALGSCIAVSIYEPATKRGALLHYMLPEASLDADKAKANPYMFADSGISSLFRALLQKGVNPRRCVVKIAGGAQVLNGSATFEIGKRNYLAARKILWKEGVLIAAEAVGGGVSRTVRLDLPSGKFWVRETGRPDIELAAKGKGASPCLTVC